MESVIQQTPVTGDQPGSVQNIQLGSSLPGTSILNDPKMIIGAVALIAVAVWWFTRKGK